MSGLSVAIPIVVRLVERVIGRGKGSDKKSVAFDILKRILGTLTGSGVGLPGDDELSSLIEAAVKALNDRKALVGEATVVSEAVTDPQLAAMGIRLIQEGMELLKRGGIG